MLQLAGECVGTKTAPEQCMCGQSPTHQGTPQAQGFVQQEQRIRVLGVDTVLDNRQYCGPQGFRGGGPGRNHDLMDFADPQGRERGRRGWTGRYKEEGEGEWVEGVRVDW
jgi:hypothetical protein